MASETKQARRGFTLLLLKPEECRLALLAACVRLIVLLATTVLDLLLPDYDTSKYITPLATSLSYCQLPRGLLQNWIVWDSVFFADIASRGYVYEQYYAFFPLLPWFASRAPGSLFASLILALNAAASVASTVLLYRLGNRLTRNDRLAALACLFFIVNPATIFHAAPYTESAYAAATLAALYSLYCCDRLLPAVAAVAVSCGLRSNGVINVGYLGHFCLCRAARTWRASKVRAMFLALQGVIAAAIATLPLIKFQYDGYMAFCRTNTESHTAWLASSAADEESEGKRNPGQGWSRPWCSSRLPYIYGFVQAEYWNVGFLRYWTLQQLPNFLLAAPVLLLSLAGLYEYCMANTVHVIKLGLAPPPSPRTIQPPWGPKACGGLGDTGRKGASDGTTGEGIGCSQRPVGLPCELRRRPIPDQGHKEAAVEEDSSATHKAAQGSYGRYDVVGETAADKHSTNTCAARDGNGRTGCGGRRGSSHAEGGGAGASGSRYGYLSPELAVFMYPWAFSTGVAATCMHVQVSTRFLLSSCPALYWYMSDLWLRSAEASGRYSDPDGKENRLERDRRNAAADGGSSSKGGSKRSIGQEGSGGEGRHDDGQECSKGRAGAKAAEVGYGFGGSSLKARRGGGGGCPSGSFLGWQSWCDVALWRWCLAYLGLGCVLYINFLPWT